MNNDINNKEEIKDTMNNNEELSHTVIQDVEFESIPEEEINDEQFKSDINTGEIGRASCRERV